ncbi:MAG: hypothetical protein IT336_10700 [Thermomicrobiales bacterium]|nr:hypothetical protein [Thermomicrobiales bacterium]
MKSISIDETEITIRQQFSGSAQDTEAVFVEENGKPIAVLMTPEQYRSLSHQRFWDSVDQMRALNADKNPADIIADMSAMIDDVRRGRRAATR